MKITITCDIDITKNNLNILINTLKYSPITGRERDCGHAQYLKTINNNTETIKSNISNIITIKNSINKTASDSNMSRASASLSLPVIGKYHKYIINNYNITFNIDSHIITINYNNYNNIFDNKLNKFIISIKKDKSYILTSLYYTPIIPFPFPSSHGIYLRLFKNMNFCIC